MKIFKIFIISVFILLISTSLCSAIIVSKDAQCIDNGIGFIGLDQDENINHYTITDRTGNISILDDTGTSITILYDDSSSYEVYGATIGSDGYLYINTDGGIFKRNSAFSTPVYLSDAEDPESATFTYVSADVTYQLVSKSGFIYYISSDTLKKINLNTLLSASVENIASIRNNAYISIDVVSDSEFYLMTRLSSSNYPFYDETYYIKNQDGTILKTFVILDGIQSNPDRSACGIQYIDSEHIYYAYNTVNSKKGYGIINSTGVSTGTWGIDAYNLDSGERIYNSFYIGSNIASGALKNDNVIEVIATEFKSTDIKYIPSALTYEEAEINSQYTTYYNNSDLYMNTYILIDLSDNDFDNYYDVSNDFQYEIDLIDSEGVQVENTIITVAFVPQGIFDRKAELTSTQKYTGVFINGTWNAALFEVDKENNTRALISDTSFEILNVSSSSTVNPPTEQEGNIFDRVINNENFGALIIVCAFVGIFASIGAKQEGEKTISGAFMGFIVGVFVGFMAGLVPLWIVLSMVLVSIGLIASGVSNKMG